MKISGFTFIRNGSKLFYPFLESIQSALPLVDEFIIALAAGDDDDTTAMEIKKLNSSKIKIISTIWEDKKFPNATVFAQQTDLAKSYCTGDWLLYLQADEVLHEKDLEIIKQQCQHFLHRYEIDGFIFSYYHFWGDYFHYHQSHGWYPFEIRIIRNLPEIHSWGDAQSFKKIDNFDGYSYRQFTPVLKLRVAKINAAIYHYGHVRPPDYMLQKKIKFDTHYHGENIAVELNSKNTYFDYGDLSRLQKFKDTHPAIMQKKINEMNWSGHLNYGTHKVDFSKRKKHKHEKFKNRLLSFIENKCLKGKSLFSFKNYDLLQ